MKILKGNKMYDLDTKSFLEIVGRYNFVELDIGTGDGKFVFEMAKTNKNKLYIGIDPNQKQLEIFSKRALRERLENVIFIVASIELLPPALKAIANTTYIILPWGSLLQAISKPNKEVLSHVIEVLKQGGRLEIVLGYSEKTEPGEVKRLDLSELNPDEIADTICSLGVSGQINRKLQKGDLKKLPSSWSKKLRFGKNRPIYYMKFIK